MQAPFLSRRSHRPSRVRGGSPATEVARARVLVVFGHSRARTPSANPHVHRPGQGTSNRRRRPRRIGRISSSASTPRRASPNPRRSRRSPRRPSVGPHRPELLKRVNVETPPTPWSWTSSSRTGTRRRGCGCGRVRQGVPAYTTKRAVARPWPERAGPAADRRSARTAGQARRQIVAAVPGRPRPRMPRRNVTRSTADRGPQESVALPLRRPTPERSSSPAIPLPPHPARSTRSTSRWVCSSGRSWAWSLAFIRDRTDERSPVGADLEATLDAPVLAAIPSVAGLEEARSGGLVTETTARSPAAEAYRTLRSGVMAWLVVAT